MVPLSGGAAASPSPPPSPTHGRFTRIIPRADLFSIEPCQLLQLYKSFSYHQNKLSTDIAEHWWFSGRILACHAGGPGSIPGQCRSIFFSPLLNLP